MKPKTRGPIGRPPYHDVKVTDADKQAQAEAALLAFRTGQSATLPDIREVFAASALRGMSHRPKAGLSGQALLVHACGQCHNKRLNQALDKSRFDVTRLDTMARDERELAVERLLLPKTHRDHMPPQLFRELDDDERSRAIAFLRQ